MSIDLIARHEKEYTTILFKCRCDDLIQIDLPRINYDEIDINHIVQTTEKIMQHITQEHGELYAYTILERIIYNILKGLVKTTTK